jgi:hypothetical protein
MVSMILNSMTTRRPYFSLRKQSAFSKSIETKVRFGSKADMCS